VKIANRPPKHFRIDKFICKGSWRENNNIRLSPLEHDILAWAINSELFEEVELSGWNSWDRTSVLNSGQLVIDWETPNIATYAEFILQRLRGLYRRK